MKYLLLFFLVNPISLLSYSFDGVNGLLPAKSIELPGVVVKIEPKTFFDYLSIDNVGYFGPGFEVIEQRLSQIDRLASDRGLTARHISSYSFGSGFLKDACFDNGLNFGTVIDIGNIVIKEKNYREASETILDRIEKYLKLTREIYENNNSPELSKYSYYNTLDMYGNIPGRTFVKKILTRNIKEVMAGKRIKKIVKSVYRNYIPLYLEENELTLGANICFKYFSNEIQFSKDMFKGIRVISVSYYFILTLEEINSNKTYIKKKCRLYPVYTPLDKVFECKKDIFRNVWLNSRYYKTYFKRVYSPVPETVKENRIRYGGEMLMAAGEELSIGRKIEAIKKLYQSFNAVESITGIENRKIIRDTLLKWLNSPAAVFIEDLKEQSKILKDLKSRMNVYDMYNNNGDIRKIISYFVMVIDKIKPELRKGHYFKLKKNMEIISSKSIAPFEKKDFSIIYSLSVKYQDELLPDKKEIAGIINIIYETLIDSGYIPVNVYGEKIDNFMIYIYDLKNKLKKDKSPELLAKYGIPVFEKVKYNIEFKKKLDNNIYSQTYLIKIK